MIKFNNKYSFNNGQGVISFQSENEGLITGKYQISGQQNTGIIEGKLVNGVLKGNYKNNSNHSSGLIEFEFSDNSFSAKWKQGLEEGPMRGRWSGILIESNNSNQQKDIEEIQYYLQCTNSGDDFNYNPNSIRLFVIYFEKISADSFKEIFMNVVGYEGGNIQGSKSYKIVVNSEYMEVYGDEFNPDYWDKKWNNNNIEYTESDVSSDEKNIFRKLILNSKEHISPEYEVEGANEDGEGFVINPEKISGLGFVDGVSVTISNGFNLDYLKIMTGKWPFITEF